jgi:hypothetical protein
MAKSRDKRRKVTEEEVARINRRRHLVDGGEPSYETPIRRVRVDERGRAAEYELCIPPEWIQWS